MTRPNGMFRLLWRSLTRLLLFLALIGCLSTCALWARTKHTAESLARHRDAPGRSTSIFICSSNGLVYVHASWRRADVPRDFPVSDARVRWSHRRFDHAPNLRIAMRSAYDSWGFAFEQQRSREVSWSSLRWRHYLLLFPHWAVVLALGVPALGLVRPVVSHARNRRRARRGLCLSCGYDLRATPGRCPECGAVPVVR